MATTKSSQQHKKVPGWRLRKRFPRESNVCWCYFSPSPWCTLWHLWVPVPISFLSLGPCQSFRKEAMMACWVLPAALWFGQGLRCLACIWLSKKWPGCIRWLWLAVACICWMGYQMHLEQSCWRGLRWKCVGNSGSRIAETPAGMLNSVGLENPGIDTFEKVTLPNIMKHIRIPLVANINGKYWKNTLSWLKGSISWMKLSCWNWTYPVPTWKTEGWL